MGLIFDSAPIGYAPSIPCGGPTRPLPITLGASCCLLFITQSRTNRTSMRARAIAAEVLGLTCSVYGVWGATTADVDRAR